MRLEIESLAGGGWGVSRTAGKVWFVRGALPGELVEAEPLRARAGVVEACTIEVVRPSPWRESNPCPVLQACGGCDFAHVRRDCAAEALRQVVAGGLRHARKELAQAVEKATVEVSPLGWRLRARLSWDAKSKVLGFRAFRSHQVVDISSCQVLSPRLMQTIPSLVDGLCSRSISDGELEWLEDLAAEHVVSGWWGKGEELPSLAGLDGWHLLDPGGQVRTGGWGETTVTMNLPIALKVPIGAFFQGNRFLAPRLFDRVVSLLRSLALDEVVDLYAGVGFFAAAGRIAGAKHLTLVESHQGAIDAARENLPDATVIGVSTEEFLTNAKSGVGTLAIVDPPRTGLSATARHELIRWSPEAIVLLSCDPACFGRDGGCLLDAGYQLSNVELWDLFAGSHHVETLALFTRHRR